MSLCPKCGAEIPEGELFCLNCSHEIQLVPDYETLSTTIIEKKKKDIRRAEQAKERELELLEQEEAYYRKNKKRKFLTISIVSVVTIIAIIILALAVKNTSVPKAVATYDDYYSQAVEAYDQGNYSHSAGLLEQALLLEPNNQDALVLKAKLEYANGNDFEAIRQLKEIIVQYPDNVDAHRELIVIYINKKDNASVNDLLNNASDSMRAALSDYISGAPIFSLEGGTYQTEQYITITTTGASIYYTTDGTEPTTSSTLYTEPVKISSGTVMLKAIASSSNGVLSTVTSASYTINRDAPDAPILSLPSGSYYGNDNKITIDVPGSYTCYFSWNSKPTPETGYKYTEPITMLSGAHILYAIYVNASGIVSPITAATFIYAAEAPAVDDGYSFPSYYYTDDNSGNSDYWSNLVNGSENTTTTPDPTEVPTVEPSPTVDPSTDSSDITEPTQEPTPEPTTPPSGGDDTPTGGDTPSGDDTPTGDDTPSGDDTPTIDEPITGDDVTSTSAASAAVEEP